MKYGSEESDRQSRLQPEQYAANTYVGGLVFNFFRQLIPGIGTVEPATADRLAEISLDLLNTLAGTLSQDVCRSSGRISLLCRAKTLIEENLYDPEP